MRKRGSRSRESWVGLVARKLKGKALEVYDKMAAREMEDCEEFKADILRTYSLLPDAYCLQFRGERKRTGDSSLEFVRYLEHSYEKRITSKHVGSLGDQKQFINDANKELVPLLREKRCRKLKEDFMSR